MKIIISPYFSELSRDFDAILYTKVHYDNIENPVIRFKILNSRWRTDAILKTSVLAINDFRREILYELKTKNPDTTNDRM